MSVFNQFKLVSCKLGASRKLALRPQGLRSYKCYKLIFGSIAVVMYRDKVYLFFFNKTNKTNIATTGSRGQTPFLIVGGHGLSIQLFTAAAQSPVGTLPQALHSCSFSRTNEILYLLTSGRMSDAANWNLEIRAVSWIRTTDHSADRALHRS